MPSRAQVSGILFTTARLELLTTQSIPCYPCADR
nr:MAG TPA: hypothetical protein [Caudoviricetes sp.]